MKARIALLFATLFAAGCASDDPEALKRAARSGEFPPVLTSPESARTFVRGTYTGGRVDRVRLGFSSFIVIFRHGSGVPVTGIAVYQRKGLRWQLVAKPRVGVGDFGRAVASDGRILMVGERSGQTAVLYDPRAKNN